MAEPRRTDQELERLLADSDVAGLAELVPTLSTAQVLTALRRLAPARGALVFRLLSKDRALRVFEKLDAPSQASLVAGLHDDRVVTLVEDLDPDDRMRFFDELPAGIVNSLLRSLSAHERTLTMPLLGYPAGSVGRRMSPEYVSLSLPVTAGAALQRVRSRGHDADAVLTLPVTDAERRLVGLVSLGDLVLADPDTEVADLTRDPVFASAHDPDEDAARACLESAVPALPVVDQEDRLVGVLTVEVALRVVEEADAEDAARAGGSEPIPGGYLAAPVRRIVSARTGWLLILGVSAVLTVGVLEQFEAALADAVVLALFIPLLTGIGGNTGSQAASTLTRALAVGDVRPRDIGRVALREVRVGLTVGLLLGSLGLIGATVFYGVEIGVIIGLTLVAVCAIAATVGGCMPLIAKRLGADPAVFSTPFISTFSDAAGLIVYFTIATTVLSL